MKRKIKKYPLAIFFTPLIGSLLFTNLVFAKTDSEKLQVAEISKVFSNLISLNSRDLRLLLVLNKAGELQGVRMTTQGIVFTISPEGRLFQRSSSDKKIPILYTNRSDQHVLKVGDINILYADTSYQRVRQVGDINILYSDTSYRHIRQVGNIVIQYKDTSYKEVVKVVGSQPGVMVRIEQ